MMAYVIVFSVLALLLFVSWAVGENRKLKR